MGTTKSAFLLGTNANLSASFTQIGAAFLIAQESMAGLDITYTTGAGETVTALQFQIYFSVNGTSNWVPETFGNIASGVDTLTPLPHQVSGGTGATIYSAKYAFPVTSRYVMVKVKETGVNTNFGTVTMTTTIASASGQSQNIQTGTTINQGTGGSSAWLVQQQASSTATITSVSSSATSVTFLSANANRKQATFYNDSTQILYLKLGTTASTSSYTIQLNAGDYYELPWPIYTGRIDGIWVSANGAVRITELT